MTKESFSPFGLADFGACSAANVLYADLANLMIGLEGEVPVLGCERVCRLFASGLFEPETGIWKISAEFSAEDIHFLKTRLGLGLSEIDRAVSSMLTPGILKKLGEVCTEASGIRPVFGNFRITRSPVFRRGTGAFAGSFTVRAAGREIPSRFGAAFGRGRIRVLVPALPPELPLPFGTAFAASRFRSALSGFLSETRTLGVRSEIPSPEVRNISVFIGRTPVPAAVF